MCAIAHAHSGMLKGHIRKFVLHLLTANLVIKHASIYFIFYYSKVFMFTQQLPYFCLNKYCFSSLKLSLCSIKQASTLTNGDLGLNDAKPPLETKNPWYSADRIHRNL